MAHRFNFNQWYPKSFDYDPILLGHNTYLLHLGYLVPEKDRTQFNVNVLKQGHKYNDSEIKSFWITVNTMSDIATTKVGQAISTELNS
tara:strand:+ start:952 stop:1215 length:264 start_codon:yes stop_codon:yes gene_type:complete